MNARRVVISGVGAVSAAGVGAPALMDTLCGPTGCVRRIDAFDPAGFPCQIAGQVPDFSARQFVPKNYRKAVKLMSRDIEYAVAAAEVAVRDAGVTTRGIDPDAVDVDGARFACNIGAGLICPDLEELGAAVTTAVDADGRFDMGRWGAEGMQNLTPLWLLKYLPNMLSCHVTIIHDLRGPSNTITCGEASALLSVGEASHQIARGAAEWALAGGAESKLNPMGMLRQTKLARLVTTGNDSPGEACRPFDVDHAGTVVGEGGGLVVLEAAETAERRGAKVYAEVVGFGAAADPVAMDPDVPHCGNVALAARKALTAAEVEPDQLDFLLAHGTGVPAEDTCEAAAITELLAGAEVPVVAITGAVGNAYAGAGGLSLVAAAMAIDRQIVPASANFAAPAAGCEGLNIPARSASKAVQTVLVQSFDRSGQSAAIVLKRYGGAA